MNRESEKPLPRVAFIDKRAIEIERASIFTRTWLLIPEFPGGVSTHIEILSGDGGGGVPFSLLDGEFILTCDAEGELHVLPNVCTHACSKILGRLQTYGQNLCCPNHRRTYALDGTCTGHELFENTPGFPSERDHLFNFAVSRWAQFFFTSLGTPIAPLSRFIGPLRRCIQELPLHEFRRTAVDGEDTMVEGNWKLHVLNYLDVSHIWYVHASSLSNRISKTHYRVVPCQYSFMQYALTPFPRYGFDREWIPKEFTALRDGFERIFALWVFVFPNLTFNFYPWGLSINAYLPTVDPSKTRFLRYHYVWRGKEELYHNKDTFWGDRDVHREDLEAIARVSEGLKSPGASFGRISRQELGPRWFNWLYRKFCPQIDYLY